MFSPYLRQLIFCENLQSLLPADLVRSQDGFMHSLPDAQAPGRQQTALEK